MIEVWISGTYEHQGFHNRQGSVAFLTLPDHEMYALTKKEIYSTDAKRKGGLNKACLLALLEALTFLKETHFKGYSPRYLTKHHINVYSHNNMVINWIKDKYSCDEFPDLLADIKQQLSRFKTVHAEHIGKLEQSHPKFNRVLHYLKIVCLDLAEDYAEYVNREWCEKVLETHQKKYLTLGEKTDADLKLNFLDGSDQVVQPTVTREEFTTFLSDVMGRVAGVSKEIYGLLFGKK